MPRMLHDEWARDAETRVLDAAIPLAPKTGWNGQLVHKAAQAAGLSDADAELLLPKGASDLAALFMRRHDDRALAALGRFDVRLLLVRERCLAAVEARIDAAMADEAAAKACRHFLALPIHVPLSLRLGWETADKLWRWAGDEATDENHYSKRVILATILATTLAARLIGGHEHARKHLSGRIDGVMAFEKWKATGAPKPSVFTQAAAEFLGKLRYGARQGPSSNSPPAP